MNTLNNLIEKYIVPHWKMFKLQDLGNTFKWLLDLHREHGDCPSIVYDYMDTESRTLKSQRNVLARVSLSDHSCAVAVNLIYSMKSTYGQDWLNFIPKASITALAHDIGKLPSIRDIQYTSREHSFIGARKLEIALAGKNETVSQSIVKAVEDHHIYSNDEFTRMLKKADCKARCDELCRVLGKIKALSISDWFSIDKLYNTLEHEINYARGVLSWKAFTFRGFIYCKPDYLYRAGQKLCRESGLIDWLFISDEEKERALTKMTDELRKNNLLSSQIGEHWYDRNFEITLIHGYRMKQRLTPLKPLLSYDMRRLEKRKIGTLKAILSVSPTCSTKGL